MDTNKLFPRLIVTFLVIGSLLAQAQPGQASSAKALDTLSGCSFGYSLQTLSPQWIDIHATGEKLVSLEGDDVILSKSLGFPFKFFENTYDSIFISTNGFISFGSQNENSYSNNYPIPAEYAPNNILAGLWDDLTVGLSYNGGSIYFQVLGASPNRQAVIAWVGVTRLRASDPLTFEIVINETSGDIVLNYGTLQGDLTQATVGIEDADGVDGCQLVYNAAGLASNQSVKLAYPTSGARVKAKPLYQGQFLVNGSIDLPFTLVNTGSSADSFHFQPAILEGANDWQVLVVGANKVPLVNTPSPVASHATFSGFIRVKAASGAPLGSFVKGQLTINSIANPAKTFTIHFDAAIPAPFAQFYIDSSAGYVRYIMPHLQQSVRVFPSFTGSSFAIARVAGLNFALSWEYIQRDVQYFENIQKVVIQPFTGLTAPINNLADNTNLSTLDANPIMAVAPNGTIGMVFVRSIRNVVTKELNTNVYFARLGANGNLLSPVKKLTNNTTYTFDVLYNLPVIAATTNNQFVISYESMTPLTSTTAKDIDIAVLDTDGQWISQPHHVTKSEIDVMEYYTPTVTQMLDGKVFLAFFSRPTGTGLGQMAYTTVQPGTGSIGAITPLNNANGEDARSATLDDGTILLAWVNDGSLSAGFTLFPQGNLAGVRAPATLNSANGWKIENISLTSEIFGNGVITWQDEWGYFLYYALVAPDGALITPPMAFLRGSNASSPNIISSSTGKGAAPLDLFWPSFLPVTSK